MNKIAQNVVCALDDKSSGGRVGLRRASAVPGLHRHHVNWEL